jgi:hypothetical protein
LSPSDAIEPLIPSLPDLGGWAGVGIASLAFVGLGRAVSLGRAAPEAALVAGWGVVCVVLTLWGIATATSLRFPGTALLALGLLALVVPRLRLALADWRGLLRIGIVALPVLVVMASARPSLPDTFLNLLPNAAYLYDHSAFPADDRWASHSLLPGAPYNLQLAAFLAAFFTTGFPANAMIAFNIVLQLTFAFFLGGILERRENEESAVPSWRAAAVGLLLATALNPGFVPRYDFSAYSEASVTVSVAFAAWFAACALDRLAARRPAGTALVLLALSLAALVNIKQDSVALAAGVVLAALVLAVGGERRGHRIAALLLAALPAALLYLAWRWYVLSHLAAGELKPLPFSQWQFANASLIIRSMARVVLEKPYFFGLAALALLGLLGRLRRRGLDHPSRVAALFLGVALIYNAALFAAYIGHFPGTIGTDAHSYFRYNTHLGLLLVLALVLLFRDAGWRHAPVAGRGLVAAALFAAVVLCPIVFLRFLRFDLEAPQQRVWELAALARSGLREDDRLALLLPGDNGSVATMLDGLIRLTPPRRPDADLRVFPTAMPDTLQEVAAQGYRHALFSCMPGPEAVLFAESASGWRVTAVETFPPPRSAHWSTVVAPAPLCL